MGLKNFLLHNKMISPLTDRIIYKRKANRDYRKNKVFCDRIFALKDTHKGEKCFIIGTGPSLTVGDLDVLCQNKVDCFGLHRIFNVFENTLWRPTYYVAQDSALIAEIQENIKAVDSKYKFLPIDFIDTFLGGAAYCYYTLREYADYKKKIRFTKKANEYLCQGFTVAYSAIQLAVWMGYSEIYLLGVDHNYSVYRDKDGNVITNDQAKDYFWGEKMQDSVYPRLDDTTRSFLAAREYVKERNVKIYNATRGGKLEVFERVNFDELFNNGYGKN